MGPKTYKLATLLDMCGGTEEALRTIFPHCLLKDDGLWLDRHAGDELALPIDSADARGPTPNLDLCERRSGSATIRR